MIGYTVEYHGSLEEFAGATGVIVATDGATYTVALESGAILRGVRGYNLTNLKPAVGPVVEEPAAPYNGYRRIAGTSDREVIVDGRRYVLECIPRLAGGGYEWEATDEAGDVVGSWRFLSRALAALRTGE